MKSSDHRMPVRYCDTLRRRNLTLRLPWRSTTWVQCFGRPLRVFSMDQDLVPRVGGCVTFLEGADGDLAGRRVDADAGDGDSRLEAGLHHPPDVGIFVGVLLVHRLRSRIAALTSTDERSHPAMCLPIHDHLAGVELPRQRPL